MPGGYTTSGFRVTVDTTDLDTKFTKSVEQLNASLTKTQKQLHLFYNEQGLLTNALGQNVEGLSASQIKLGQYVDELGKTRTFQGGFIDGLNKSQIAMGFYSDELGNVYNKTGALVIPTKKLGTALATTTKSTVDATKASAQAAAQADAMGAKFAAAGGKLAAATGTIGALSSAIIGCTASSGALGGALSSAGVALAQAVTMFSAYQQVVAFSNAVKGAAASVGILNATLTALGGPVGIALLAIGAIVAAGAALFKWRSNSIEKLSDSYKDLEKEAKKAGESVRNLNKLLSFGVFGRDYSSEYLQDLLNKLEAIRQRMKAIIDAGIPRGQDKTLESLYNQYKNTVADINKLKRDRLSQIVEDFRSESEKTLDKWIEAQLLYNEALNSPDSTALERAALKKKVEDLAKLYDQQKKTERVAQRYNGIVARVEEFSKKQASAAIDLAAFSRDMQDLSNAIQEGAVDWTAAREFYAQTLDENAQKLAELTKIDPSEVSFASTFARASQATRDKLRALEDSFEQGAINARSLSGSMRPLEIQAERDAIGDAMRKAADSYKAGAINAAQYARLSEENSKKLEDLKVQEIELTADVCQQMQKLADAYARGEISQKLYSDELDKRRSQLAAELGVQITPDARNSATSVSEDLDKAFAAYGANALSINQLTDVINQLQARASSTSNALTSLEEYIKNDPTLAAREKYAQTLDAASILARKSDFERERAARLREEADKELVDAEKARAKMLASIDEALARGAIDEAAAAKMRAAEDEKLAAAQETRKKAFDGASQIELDAAKLQESSTAKLAEAQDKLGSDLERAAAAGDRLATAQINHAEALEKIDELEKAGVYSKERADALRAAADEKLAAVEKELVEARRKDLRQTLNVDSIMSSLKTPAERFESSINKIAEAAEEGALTMGEARALVDAATSDYQKTLDEISKKAKDERLKELDKVGTGVASGERGSTALYNAIVRTQGVQYQEIIRQTTTSILETTKEALEYQRATAWSNEVVANALANAQPIAVWG